MITLHAIFEGSLTPLFFNHRLLVAHFKWHLFFELLTIGSMGDRRGVKLGSRLLEGHRLRHIGHIDAAAGSLALVRWTLIIKIVDCDILL